MNIPQGTYTAIVTPFREDGHIDWKALELLVEEQIAAGVSGIVPCGTTGEAPTLEPDEMSEIVRRISVQAKGRVLVMAGTGSNSTKKTIAASMEAELAGADALLVVTPYYNKPTQKGMFLHYSEIAKSVHTPIVIYNIKGRTAVNLETSALLRLIEEHPVIQGVKEASGDLTQIEAVINQTPDYFTVLSGDDALTSQIMKYGGDGVISVASNVVPARVKEVVDAGLNRDYTHAHALEAKLRDLYSALFLETNPIPVKAALAMMGKIQEEYRLPMCEMDKGKRGDLRQALLRYGLYEIKDQQS